MKRFAVALLAARQVSDGVDTLLRIAVISAVSKEEAEGIGTLYLDDMNPRKDGWILAANAVEIRREAGMFSTLKRLFGPR